MKPTVRWSFTRGCLLGGALKNHTCGRERKRSRGKTRRDVGPTPASDRPMWCSGLRMMGLQNDLKYSRDGQTFIDQSLDVGSPGRDMTLAEVDSCN